MKVWSHVLLQYSVLCWSYIHTMVGNMAQIALTHRRRSATWETPTWGPILMSRMNGSWPWGPHWYLNCWKTDPTPIKVKWKMPCRDTYFNGSNHQYMSFKIKFHASGTRDRKSGLLIGIYGGSGVTYLCQKSLKKLSFPSIFPTHHDCHPSNWPNMAML